MVRFLFSVLSLMMLSEEELRFNYSYKQGYDTSCGIAVTASILNTYWNVPVIEADMYQDMILNRYKEGELTYTINFLTISEYLTQKKIQSRAYKMDWLTLEDTLYKGFAPIIVNYQKPRPHFALLVHIYENYAYVADPAKGFELIEKNQFEKIYSGNVLLTASNTVEKTMKLLKGLRQMKQNGLND